MVLGDTTDAWIYSLDAIQAAIQNLVYGCGNVPQITAESSDTPPIHCAQHEQQSVNMCI